MARKEILCDVLIIGSSMAGACLARQLKIKHPQLDIVVLERKTQFDHWVGESTLESFWEYAAKDLHLGFYLDTSHLYKHGLRFFYDSPEHDLPIDEMSEVGRTWFHTTPAHQINRKRFDTDLYHMNIEAGIDVRLGVRATDITLDAESGHTVVASDGQYRCRWLIDAAGFASPVGKKLKLIQSNNDHHPIDSYWGRFKHIVNLDLLGNSEWRNRVNHTTRTLATTHFMYGGYWIWLIPIDADTFSIGVTVRTDLCSVKIDNEFDFIEFLKTHRCMRQLLGGKSELQDFRRLRGISRQSSQSFSQERWFLTGMASAVLDPLLSPGSALLSDNNRMIGDLIATDMAGDERAFRNKVKAYNVFNQVWLKNFFLHIKGHYHDCFDRQRANFETLLMQWFGVILPTSMKQDWGYDPSMSDEEFDQLEHKVDMMLKNSCIHRVEHIAQELQELLDERDMAYVNNRGQFYDIEIDARFMANTRTMGKTLCPQGIAEIENAMLRVGLTRSLQRLAEIEGLDCAGETLAEVVQNAMDESLSLRQALEQLKIRHSAYNDIMTQHHSAA
ncbi:MAG: hypothetical protein Tsb002_18300 [Wenzhouxiangellaceae bacterium]